MKFDYPGTPVKQGSKGPSAALVQAVIGAKADGDFGPKSVEALKKWQTANGLTADGSVGPVTWKKMFN
jgi:peptidoglycan hydrolase-like protein with peptidoglycan-binding domain